MNSNFLMNLKNVQGFEKVREFGKHFMNFKKVHKLKNN